MYKTVIRPIFFLFSPEHIHKLLVSGLKLCSKISFICKILNKFFCIKDTDLETRLCGISFPNRIGLAAGFDKDAELVNIMENFGFGFIEIGTLTPKPQQGNAKPRLFRLVQDEALINRMGFNNKGVHLAVNKLREARKKTKIIVGGNIGKNTETVNEEAIHDYIYCFEELYDYVDYFVVNISCPNIKNLDQLADQDNLENILHSIHEKRSEKDKYKPVFVKISPDLNHNEIDNTLKVIAHCKMDGIIAGNTTKNRKFLISPQETIEKIGEGGLSGKPLREKSTEMIRYIHKKTEGKIPIIGVGGIMTPRDALDKLAAGASLVQVYSGWIYEGPYFVKKINQLILNNLKK